MEERRWERLIADADAVGADQDALLRELARREGGRNAFPEDLLARGRQIFAAVEATVADGLCKDPEAKTLLESNGPATSEALTIVPLLMNLLDGQALKDESVAIVALLIVRMGLREFCRRRGRPG